MLAIERANQLPRAGAQSRICFQMAIGLSFDFVETVYLFFGEARCLTSYQMMVYPALITSCFVPVIMGGWVRGDL
jgi:hypothetical protein